MLFKQIQLFQITMPMPSAADLLSERLSALEFKPCLPSMPSSMGWVPPIDEEEAPLAIGVNGCFMISLQIEEKILPASVVGQTLKEKIKQIELAEARKVRQKEKLSYKDDVIHTLLPRAFSKFTQICAYIDTRNKWLVLNNASPAKTEIFLSMFKKSFGDGICSYEVTKPSAIITHWLKNRDNPTNFSIEKACVLQDPKQETRVIRCQHQDLYAPSIQDLLKDGCEAIQTALCWQDRVNFVMADDFSLRSVKFANDELADIKDEIETKRQKFAADFVLMAESFTGLLTDLLEIFAARAQKNEEKAKFAMVG